MQHLPDRSGRKRPAQHAVIRTGTHSARVADVVNPLVFQTGSDVTSNSPLYAASKYWGNASVVFATGNAGRSVVAFGVSAPNHAAQTGVDVQIVSDRVTQFSGQLNALSFESTVVNAAFICHTAQPVITHFETEVRVNLVTTKRTSTKLIVTGRTVVVLETVTVETGVVILGPTQFTTCIPVLSFGAACATVAKPASATAIAIAVFFIFCASLSSKIRHEVTKDLTVKSFTGGVTCC